MAVYKANIQYNGSLEKLNSTIVVREGFKNKEMIGYIWSPTASMRTLKHFLEADSKHKVRV